MTENPNIAVVLEWSGDNWRATAPMLSTTGIDTAQARARVQTALKQQFGSDTQIECHLTLPPGHQSLVGEFEGRRRQLLLELAEAAPAHRVDLHAQLQAIYPPLVKALVEIRVAQRDVCDLLGVSAAELGAVLEHTTRADAPPSAF